jgi:serine phosphatase RsbU (regulator of sigma subunit)
VANARLYQKTKRLGLEYSLLAQVAADVGKSLSLEGVLKRILKNLKKLIPFDAAAIFVLDQRQGRMVSMLHEGYAKGIGEQINVKSDEGLVSLAARRKRGIIVDDVRTSEIYVNTRKTTRSEMVAPMLSRGDVIGLFNLESDKIGAYHNDHLRLLEAFAGQASVAIERAHLYEERRVKLDMQKELRLARTVQEFFTPKKSKTFGNFRVAGVNFPSLEVSGDYFDYFPVKDSLLAFAIADVAGKGAPASLIMSSMRATLHTVAPYLASARQIALRANEILLETVRPQDFVTAFVGVLNPTTGELTYCNAGHNPPILMRKDGTYRLLESGGPVLGVFEDIPLLEGRLRLRDDTLVCYTDGATEARNATDEEYGEKRLLASIKKSFDLTPYKSCRAMFASLKRFIKDGEQTDDVTYLVLKRKP